MAERLGGDSSRGRRHHHIPDPHQVVQGRGQDEQPPDPTHPAMAGLPQERHGLHPSEDFLHALAFLLTDRVPRMAGRPASIALARRLVCYATCGVSLSERSAATKPRVSYPLSAPTEAPRRRFVAIAMAVSRSAIPVA